jgi:probable rRNA maturation factor
LDCSAIPDSVCELSILLTDNHEVQSLNRDFRNRDTPTDVLSFSLLEGDDPTPGAISLGDIAISFETCARQAEAMGCTCGEELLRLLVHGLLHLFGYDHENVSEEAAERMFSLQDSLLEEFAGESVGLLGG